MLFHPPLRRLRETVEKGHELGRRFWWDELAKAKRAELGWSNMLFGMREGANPRGIVTTTPRPVSLIKKLLKSPSTFWSAEASAAGDGIDPLRRRVVAAGRCRGAWRQMDRAVRRSVAVLARRLRDEPAHASPKTPSST
jgi:hypothetical protein